MRNLQFTFFLFCGIIFLKTESAFGQNLQFNQAIFNTYGPGNADGNAATPMFTGILVVGANQILKVTGVSCTSVNSTSSGITIPQTGYMTINNHNIVSLALNLELWLPSGSYVIKGLESVPTNQTSGTYQGLITGILYDVVP
jgi:hypothetical protein